MTWRSAGGIHKSSLERDESSARHRRPGRATKGDPLLSEEQAGPRFEDELRYNTRVVLMSVGMPLAFLVGGLTGAINPGNSWAWRAACLPFALLGALLMTSYILRFNSDLSGPMWQRTRLRRGTRAALRYSHPSYMAVMWTIGCFYLVVSLFRWVTGWLS